MRTTSALKKTLTYNLLTLCLGPARLLPIRSDGNSNHVNSTTETFVTAYYSAWDNDRATLGELYRPTSRIVWNGNPISGRDEMASLVEKMPASKHDVRKCLERKGLMLMLCLRSL